MSLCMQVAWQAQRETGLSVSFFIPGNQAA